MEPESGPTENQNNRYSLNQALKISLQPPDGLSMFIADTNDNFNPLESVNTDIPEFEANGIGDGESQENKPDDMAKTF